MKDEGTNAEFFKKQTVHLLGDRPALELFPDLDKLDHEKEFSTVYDDKCVECDMAAPKCFLEDLAEQRRILSE